MSKVNPDTSHTPQLTSLNTQPVQGKVSMSSGSVTARFFSAGDELEATSYKNVVIEDLSQPSLASEFSSFDKVPKRRAPLFAVLSYLTLFVIVLVNWSDIQWLRKQPIKLVQVYEAARAALPSRARTEKSVAVPTQLPTPSNQATPQAVRETVPKFATENQIPGPQESPPVANAPTRKTKVQPLRGYLWSPSANALVPAVSATAEFDSPTTTQPKQGPEVSDPIPRPE